MSSSPLSSFQIAFPASELPLGKSKRIVIEEIPIAVFHVEQGFFAIADACSHQGASLAFGSLEGCQVACPRHGAMFDVRNGNVITLPALRGVRSFPVQVVDGNILISVSESMDQPKLLKF